MIGAYLLVYWGADGASQRIKGATNKSGTCVAGLVTGRFSQRVGSVDRHYSQIGNGPYFPRGKTQHMIHRAFEDAGLEFLEPDGVRHRPDDIAVYQGPEGARAFFDDIYNVACKNRGEIIQVWDSAQSIFEVLSQYRSVHFKRMEGISDTGSVKCILTMDFDFTPASYCEYRYLSKHYVNSVPFYVYGDKYAIILFKDDPSPRIIVIQSRTASEAFRQQFKSMWDKAISHYPSSTE